jgi:uncharacterized protein (TIGR02421 family)
MDNKPMGDDEPPSRLVTPYEIAARELGDRLTAAQRPVRVLDAVRWDADVAHAFLARGGREPPPVTAAYYAARPLGFDPVAKAQELRAIERDCHSRLGRHDPLGRLIRHRCRQCRGAVAMLARRGTPAFARLSHELFGSPAPGEDTQVAAVIAALVRRAATHHVFPAAPLSAPEASVVLAERLRKTFGGGFRIRLSTTLLADATAGGRTIKLRLGAHFTPADITLLAVHEGWVHLGTTFNGRRQPICTFLGQGPPSTACTQEGLAVLCEVLTGTCDTGRAQRLGRRYQAVRMAQAGADFIDVYRHFLEAHDDPHDSFQQAARVFRGSLPTGCGPFTKDLAYALGFTRILRAVRASLGRGERARFTLLFCGKTALDELGTLTQLAEAGLLRPPDFLPPPVNDPATLARATSLLPASSRDGRARRFSGNLLADPL